MTKVQKPKKQIIAKPLRHAKWFIAVAILAVAVITFMFVKDQRENYYSETYTATSENIDITTTLSGRLIPQTTLDLRFNESGTISNLYVIEGETVTPGQKLAELSVDLILAEKGEINAEINTQQAILNELLAGTRPEEIVQQQAVYELAQLERNHSLADLSAILQDAQNDADNAIRNTVDDFFINARSANPQLSFALSNNQGLESEIEFQRTIIESLLKDWLNLRITSSTIILDNYEEISNQILDYLVSIRDFLSLAALTVNSTESSSDLSNTTLRTWKTNIATERNILNSNIQDIQNQEQTIKEKTLSIVQSLSQLEQLINGSTPESIAKQRAQISQAKARLNTITAKLKNRSIFSPAEGLISDIKFAEGETITAQDTVLTMISAGNFEVELEVPELNIKSISLGDLARVTFAAIGDKEFTGTISSIKETANTDTNLVPFYDVRVALDSDQTELKAGLISDVEVVTNNLGNQIAVPARYVEFSETTNEYFVLVMDALGQVSKRVVVSGVLTPEGKTIIESGINEGETLVIQ